MTHMSIIINNYSTDHMIFQVNCT